MKRHINKRAVLRRIEKKYGYLIDKLLNEYADKTMGEFLPALDKLKTEMENEMRSCGVLDEGNGHNMDAKNGSGDAGQGAVHIFDGRDRVFENSASGT